MSGLLEFHGLDAGDRLDDPMERHRGALRLTTRAQTLETGATAST
ncbi:hypothetical protein [Gulosibacter molinativorax]|nr:hypothetical protein [Gulosibacter molinativorax]